MFFHVRGLFLLELRAQWTSVDAARKETSARDSAATAAAAAARTAEEAAAAESASVRSRALELDARVKDLQSREGRAAAASEALAGRAAAQEAAERALVEREAAARGAAQEATAAHSAARVAAEAVASDEGRLRSAQVLLAERARELEAHAEDVGKRERKVRACAAQPRTARGDARRGAARCGAQLAKQAKAVGEAQAALAEARSRMQAREGETSLSVRCWGAASARAATVAV